ncbi:MAG TPA: hypothetical protein VFC53_10985 [Dehalococcoidia bacterium]|jgi:hypothetical protein|nr:hypothetical protein [Dehalococcoidia bacterium]
MIRSLITTILGLFWAFVLLLVGARFFALLFDANRGSEIVQRIYRHSDFWVKPFFGMFDLSNKAVTDTGGVFEPASLIALVVYLVIGLIVLALLSMPYAVTRRHTHYAP